MKFLLTSFLLLFAALLTRPASYLRHLPTATATLTALPAASPTPTPVPAIKHVFIIVEENHNWSEIHGSPDAPYINGTLLPTGAHAEDYYNPPSIHPSLPNYLWLEAGTNFGITDDGPPNEHSQSTDQHLVALLEKAGISWRAYEESVSGTTCPLSDAYPYAVRHDPFVYFNDVTGNGNSSSSECLSHIRPFTDLAADLSAGTTGSYTFITPNVCDDGHDACSPANNPVKQTDAWLSQTVPLIMASPAYRDDGALFITWDEGSHSSDGPIGMIVESPLAKPGYSNSTRYTHSSTLRTVEEILGVRPFLGDAASSVDLSDLFLQGVIDR